MSEPLTNDPKKDSAKILSEEDSLRCENLDLKNQVLRLKKRILSLEAEIYEMSEVTQKIERSTFLKKLGLDKDKRISFVRQPDGRYEVHVGEAPEKS